MKTFVINRVKFFYLLCNWMTKSFIYYFKKNKKTIYSINNCEIYYINLNHRIDRKKLIENEFLKLQITHAIRFNAIKNNNGALGCSISHKSIYELVKNSNKLVLICEDDIQFNSSKFYLDKLINDFNNDIRLDVLCLAYSSFLNFSISDDFYITSNTQTMSCYILKPHVIKKFIEIANESIYGLMNFKNEQTYAIDQVWKKLQYLYVFAIPKIRVASQRKSYSDIKKLEVDYNV
jgi:hypothetical protein